MPTYDYQCANCGHEFEAFQSITANALRKCPECKKFKLKRLIGTGAGIIFKGSGFYETDYRSESYQKAAKADSQAAKETSESKKTSDQSSANENAKASSSSTVKSTSSKNGQGSASRNKKAAKVS